MADYMILRPGESDVFSIDFTRRMSGVSGVSFGWHVPTPLAAIASASGVSGRSISIQLASGRAGDVYRVSGNVVTSDGRRLYDWIDIHCG